MLKEKLYNYFLKQDENKKQNEEITFAPSYFTSCKRQIFYKKTCTKISNPISEAAYFKMELGNAGHEKIQDIISKIDDVKLIECENLKEIEWNDLKWFYKIDGLIEIDKRYILEIKTVYAAGFRFIENEPKPEHLIQAYLYMLFEKIDDCILLYVGRDNGFMIEYHYNIKDFDQSFKQKIQSKVNNLRQLKSKIENKELPDRDFQIQLKNMDNYISDNFIKDKEKYKTAWQCGYCAYKNKCWEKEYNEIKNYKFYINGVFE